MSEKTNANRKAISSSASSRLSSHPVILGRQGRSAQCPPLVVAPAHGTLQLVPVRVGDTPTSSSASSGESRAMLASSNVSLDGRRPVQIMADPRVYRGSVFANRRLANDRARHAEQAESKEKRYRVGVLRDQLTSLLPRVPMPGKVHRAPAPIHKTRSPTYLPDISNGTASIDKTRNKSFTTARFAPVRTRPTGNGDIFSKPSPPPPPSFPVKVVVNFEKAATSEGPVGYRRHSRHVATSQTATPPPSSRPVYPIVESGVQTDDNFDQKFESLVKELANSAIEMAQINLETENQLEAARKTAEATAQELRAVTRKQNAESADWRRQIHQKNMELETFKRQEAQAREAQLLAQITCEEVTRKTLENLKILERNSKKSIGLDTRDMVLLEQKMSLVTAELEKDFFPWMFHRAEQLFRHRIARHHLDHSLLNEQHFRREQAKRRLINMNSNAFS